MSRVSNRILTASHASLMFRITVTLGFFDDIYIPAENLQNTSRFDETEHVWIWEYESEDGKHDLFMDTGI